MLFGHKVMNQSRIKKELPLIRKELSLNKGTSAKGVHVLCTTRKSSHPVKVRPVCNAEVTASCGSRNRAIFA
ncbi:hypothetical protein NBRC111894_4628 [Sporolactobacillus inulinus]|uniref:Uncharacterized protein n=1 Tax=Sporolactobacillus inulinus TaxID=2078 RepID=A0A4Y1ZJE8_9BACL|nr:hypothetical protein NBRC111894_4628 [Sporolactobacillus inulinus]